MFDPIPAWAKERFSQKTVKLEGESVPYLVGGKGPALLLLHGLSASLDWWRYNANELARHFTVYLVDLPGFGRQGHLPTSGSMPHYSDWVYRFIVAAGIDYCHILGHSMGGHIATRLAAASPELVDKLVLVAPAGVLPDAELEHFVLPVLKLLRELPPRLLPLALRDVRRADLRTTWRSGQSLIENDILHLLEFVNVPVLIIWGEEDDIIPIELAETFLDRLPDARITRFPGAGHLLMVDEPERFNREVARFLSEEKP